MNDSIFRKQFGKVKDNQNGTHTRVMETNADALAEKAANILSHVVDVTSGPTEALAILSYLVEHLKKETGISHVEMMENPPA
jgi:hypothetical protein